MASVPCNAFADDLHTVGILSAYHVQYWDCMCASVLSILFICSVRNHSFGIGDSLLAHLRLAIAVLIRRTPLLKIERGCSDRLHFSHIVGRRYYVAPVGALRDLDLGSPWGPEWLLDCCNTRDVMWAGA